MNRAVFAITLATVAATACAGGKLTGAQYRNNAGGEIRNPSADRAADDLAGRPVYEPFPSARYELPVRAGSSPDSHREGDGPGSVPPQRQSRNPADK